jgi:hypothetical protein
MKSGNLTEKSTERKEYPYCASGITGYGVGHWVDDFRPVLNPVVFQNIHRKLFAAFETVMTSCGKNSPEYWCGAVHYKMPRDLSLHYFRYLEIRELESEGYSGIILKNGQKRSLQDELEEISKRAESVIFRNKVTASEKLRETLRLLKINLKSCGIGNFLTCLAPDYKCCVIADPDDFYVKAYCAENNLRPMCLRTLLFLSGGTESASGKNSAGDLFIENFFKEVFRQLPESEEFFTEKIISYYKNLFAGTLFNFNRITEKLRKRKLGTLLLESMTNAECRLPAAVWKSLGGQVVGFAHGNAYLSCIGGSDETNGAHLVISDFVVGSQGEKSNLEHLRAILPSPLNGDDRIIYLKQDIYKELREKYKNASAETAARNPDDIKEIMIVGFPLDSFYYPGLPGHDALTYTHLTLRIMKDLKQAGYRIIYKSHPDTLKESEGIFDSFADSVISERFETVYERADCILFPSPYSTTFGFTLLTDKPVVYMRNCEWNYEPDELTQALHRRTVPVNVSFDDKYVLKYSTEELLNAVRESAERLDIKAVEKYAV